MLLLNETGTNRGNMVLVFLYDPIQVDNAMVEQEVTIDPPTPVSTKAVPTGTVLVAQAMAMLRTRLTGPTSLTGAATVKVTAMLQTIRTMDRRLKQTPLARTPVTTWALQEPLKLLMAYCQLLGALPALELLRTGLWFRQLLLPFTDRLQPLQRLPLFLVWPIRASSNPATPDSLHRCPRTIPRLLPLHHRHSLHPLPLHSRQLTNWE